MSRQQTPMPEFLSRAPSAHHHHHHHHHAEPVDPNIEQIESNLSKYSLNGSAQMSIEMFDAELSRYNDTSDASTANHSETPSASSLLHHPIHHQNPSPITTISTATPIDSSSSSSDTLSKIETVNNEDASRVQYGSVINRLLPETDVNNGRIHGHIHNFENFTYIHGHIHTREDDVQRLSTNKDEITLKAAEEVSNQEADIGTFPNTNQSQFSDCHHFEFLNCHDHIHSKDDVVLDDPNLVCQEDENCKPKIVEICCDNDHSLIFDDKENPKERRVSFNSGAPFIPNLPNCTELHCHDDFSMNGRTNLSSPNKLAAQYDSRVFQNADKDSCFLLDNCKNDAECIDIKCDLNTTCDIDELCCKICDEIDRTNNSNQPKQENQEALLKYDSSDPHCHTHDEHRHNHEEFANHHHHHHHKRNRDEDQEPIYHHLHHSHTNHSLNHHHHHIQVHDHGTNKRCKTHDYLSAPVNSDNSLINFEWNFKNTESICEWDSCFTTLDNSFQLQNHIFENHLLNNGADANAGDGVALLKNSNVQSKCEWKDCDFESFDLFELVNHINSQHVISNPPASIKTDTLKKAKPPKPQKKTEEETVCRWHDPETNEKCLRSFETPKELTDHLINDHIGTGKSQYICNWENCARHGKVFNQKQKIIRHLHVHTRFKPFQCTICNHSFAVESMLEQHMRTHSGEKPYSCKVCGKTFATSSSLSIHVRIHTGEKPLVCKYPGCGKRFSESSNLTKHMKTHEKEFKCQFCSKSFGKKKQLVNHVIKYHP